MCNNQCADPPLLASVLHLLLLPLSHLQLTLQHTSHQTKSTKQIVRRREQALVSLHNFVRIHTELATGDQKYGVMRT